MLFFKYGKYKQIPYDYIAENYVLFKFNACK